VTGLVQPSENDVVYERVSSALADVTGQLSRRHYNEKCHKLAMEWPALAAALGDWCNLHSLGAPGPFRHAQNVMNQELREGNQNRKTGS
jgi:hypothetical protein